MIYGRSNFDTQKQEILPHVEIPRVEMRLVRQFNSDVPKRKYFYPKQIMVRWTIKLRWF